MVDTSDQPFPYDDISSDEDEKISGFYALLPKLIRTRLRRLSLLRRSAHEHNRSYDGTQGDRRRLSTEYSEPRTPPPGYRSRASISEAVSDTETFEEGVSQRPSSSASSRSLRDDGHGIRWKFADQGLSLINIAAQEDTGRKRARMQRSPPLSRQLYIHGVTYLLQGLPSNLSSEERFSVWSATPPEVRDVSATSMDIIRVGHRQFTDEDLEEPSLLHRALAAFVVRLFIFCQIILPYIKVFCAAAYQYERKYHISEQVISSSMTTMGGVMKSSVQFGNAVCRMNDGKVGQAINDATVWWVKGVAGGLQEGVGAGLVVLGVDNAGKQRLGSKSVN